MPAERAFDLPDDKRPDEEKNQPHQGRLQSSFDAIGSRRRRARHAADALEKTPGPFAKHIYSAA
jgi:hypothetical protein